MVKKSGGTNKVGGPAWQVVVNALTEEIFCQRYPAGTALPGEYPLCDRFGCSRTTVRRAMVELEKRGLIYRHHGKGTFAHPVNNAHVPPMALLIRHPEKLRGDYFVELIRGGNSYLNSLGSNLTIISTEPGQWSAKQAEQWAGVIIVPAGVTVADVERLDALGLAYITVMESELPGHRICLNPERRAYELTKLLCEHGHRHIGLVSGHFQHAEKYKRAGIDAALKEYGVELGEGADIPTDYDIDKAEQAAVQLLTEHKEITAVIAFDDALAMQVMAVAAKLGIKVPDELSVVGFNNAVFGSLAVPALTTVHFAAYEAGRAACRLLAGYYLKKSPLKSVTIPTGLVLRDSVARVKKRKDFK